MTEQADLSQATIMTGMASLNSSILPTNNAKCVYVAWAFFGNQPFTIADFERTVKRYNLGHHAAAETEARTNIFIEGGSDAQTLLAIMTSVQKESGLFFEDPSAATAVGFIEEKVKPYLTAFSFPDATQWVRRPLCQKRQKPFQTHPNEVPV